jgi:thiosulfate/3-mercaptopyruvate sulfurtransferase
MVKDPSFADGMRVCGECHEDIVKRGANSLHTTLKPYQTMMEARAADTPHVRGQLALAREASCQSCHASCGQCHISRPTSVGGGLLNAHLIQKTPPPQQTCTACHGSRIQKEYFGENEGVKADIHRLRRMQCQDCHKGDEMHGTGAAYEHRYKVENAPLCIDCHKDILAANAPNLETHKTHQANTDCEVCHAQAYKNCSSCHIAKNEKGVAFFKTKESWLDFKIGLNPAPDKRHPEQFVVVRHVPVDHESFDFYAKGALTRFDRLPTWKFATPHNIQRKTPQNAACNNCHGNAKLFLQAKDVDPKELKANAKVIVPLDRVPKAQ